MPPSSARPDPQAPSPREDSHSGGFVAASRSDEFWEIAVAVNAAFKGLLGYFGQSGHVCERTIPVPGHLDTSRGLDVFLDTCADRLIASGLLDHGDVVVLAEKPLAVAQGRVARRDVLGGADPKRLHELDRSALAAHVSQLVGMTVSANDLIRVDWVEGDDEALVVLGAQGHNEMCAELAARLRRAGAPDVDVVVSDTDTGLDVRSPLIGTLTVGATPLGATSGLNLYEAMRCAVAAEFERGAARTVPLVICRPAARCSDRLQCGEPRPYGGLLDRRQEVRITCA